MIGDLNEEDAYREYCLMESATEIQTPNTVRVPLVMYVGGQRRNLGTADVIYLNEDERIKFSASELIAEAFDVRQKRIIRDSIDGVEE